MADVSSPSSSVVKLTVNVMRNLYEKLREVAARRSISRTEALHQALLVYTFIDEALEHGEKFLIQDRQGRLQQVFFDRIGQEPPAPRAAKLAALVEQIKGSLP
jgi:hypothetical protein